MLTIFPVKSDKSPAVPKGTDWKEYRGEVNTPMKGVVVPKGAIVIDLDKYKGVTREDVESALGCELEWDDALLQTTKNGGEHYAFKINPLERLKQGSDVLGVVGFDTRTQGSGYIATGEGYEDMTILGVIETLEELDLPCLPKVAIEALRNGGAGEEESDLMSAVAAQPLDITDDEIEHYMSKLDPSLAIEQDTWLSVGMALYHQTQGSEFGWQQFDKFSKQCEDKYDERKNRTRWESFNSSNRSAPRTFATILKLAGGFEAKKELVAKTVNKNIDEAETLDDIKRELQRLADVKLDNLTLDVALKKVQSKYTEIMGSTPSIPAIKKEIKALRGDSNTGDFVEDYVFLTATGEYCCRGTKAVMGPRAFDVKHNRETPLNSDGEKQTACTFANDKIDVVENTMYFPIAGEMFTHEGLDYLNSYQPSRVKPVRVGTTDIVDRVKGHIAHLLPDTREQGIIIDYLAHNVQYPGKKLQWAIVLQGVQGDGKSFLSEMMKHVMGNNNVRLMNVQTLESAFTGWATGQCMTFIEELKLDNYRKYEVLNNLKPYISNPVVEETKKGKDPRTVINTTNYFALTNFKDAIPIDANDRRYCVLFSQWQRKDALAAWMEENPNYYHNIYEDMRQNVGEILSWLMSHKISDEFLAMKRAPDTNAKMEMQELSRSPEQVALTEALERFDEKCQVENDEVDISHLQKLVKDAQMFGDFEDFPQTKRLKSALMEMGFELVGRRRTKFSDGDKKHTVYKK